MIPSNRYVADKLESTIVYERGGGGISFYKRKTFVPG